MNERFGPAGRLARAFIASKLTPLIIVSAALLGVGAVLMLPREGEPRIIVLMTLYTGWNVTRPPKNFAPAVIWRKVQQLSLSAFTSECRFDEKDKLRS